MPATANPYDQPFANISDTNSPEYIAFLRKLAMDQSIREMTMNQIANSNAPQAPVLRTLPQAPQPQPVVPPVAGQPGVAPAPVPQQMPVPANPAAIPQAPINPGPTPPQPQAQNPQMPQMAGPDPFAGGAPIPGMKGPPVDEADAANRRTGWVNFVNRIKTDPNMQLALVRFATQILQPVAPGQNQVGHLAGALQGSIDYAALNKQRLAELGRTEAGTGLTAAQTTTEEKRPAQVEAETGRIEATTERIQEMTPKEVALADAQIKKIQTELGLTEQQIEQIGIDNDLKGMPRYKEAMLKLLEARAWSYRNPAASIKAQMNARKVWTDDMAQHILRSDSTLARLAETDPQKAYSEAYQRANQLYFASGAEQQTIDKQAEAQYEILRRQWEQNPSGMSFDQYITAWAGDIMQPSQNLPLIRAVVNHHDAQAGSQRSPKGLNTDPSKTRPPLSTFETK